MPAVWFCAVFITAFFVSGRAMAQIKQVEGYDGYKFGMTIDQAKKVKPAAKQTRCEFAGVATCLEYKTKLSAFPATVTVQFKGEAPLLSQILITIRSLDKPVLHSCRDVGEEVLRLLVAKYGDKPFIKNHEATWTSPEGGSVSLLSLCVGEAGNGVNVITYTLSSPL
jgi:hypothetical protein